MVITPSISLGKSTLSLVLSLVTSEGSLDLNVDFPPEDAGVFLNQPVQERLAL
jgi:hypothetical protein